ncbi:MAG: hypothetical protein WBG70_05435 [Spirulinaceae cyanobacterium]
MNIEQVPASELIAKANPLEFFNEVYAAYQQAETATGSLIERFYNLGDFTIKLCFAGEALVGYLTPAFAHLATQSTPKPNLTICLWDSASTKTKMPPPPWQGAQLQQRGEILGFNNERIHTTFQWGANTLSMLDSDTYGGLRLRNLGLYWVNDAKLLPYWESGSPLRTILHIWLGKRGVQMVHAGAVGLPSGGVLLAGKGGSGKSTTALCCLNSDLFYASDDYVLLASQPTPQVHSIYNTGKKRPDDIDRLPFLKSIISNRDRLDSEKALYFLHQHFPEKIISGFPLKAIFVPRVTGKVETSLSKASSVAGLSALVPSTIKQLPNAGKEACLIMTEVAQKVPCYYLNLGTEIKQIPEVIFDFLSQ